MIQCKECQSGTIVKNGIVREKQRYKCKSCGCNFIIGDSRINPATELKRHTCVLFYSLGKASFRFLARLFDVSPATTYQWVRKTAETLGEPVVSAGVKEIEIDEMWHFLHSKKTKDGSSKLWIVTHGELSSGCRWSWCCNGQKIILQARTLEWLSFLYRRLGCFRKSLTTRETRHREKIYNSHWARQLKYPSSSGENDPKNEDCQPVRGDDQPFHEVMACVDYSRDLHWVSKEIYIYL